MHRDFNNLQRHCGIRSKYLLGTVLWNVLTGTSTLKSLFHSYLADSLQNNTALALHIL